MKIEKRFAKLVRRAVKLNHEIHVVVVPGHPTPGDLMVFSPMDAELVNNGDIEAHLDLIAEYLDGPEAARIGELHVARSAEVTRLTDLYGEHGRKAAMIAELDQEDAALAQLALESIDRIKSLESEITDLEIRTQGGVHAEAVARSRSRDEDTLDAERLLNQMFADLGDALGDVEEQEITTATSEA